MVRLYSYGIALEADLAEIAPNVAMPVGAGTLMSMAEVERRIADVDHSMTALEGWKALKGETTLTPALESVKGVLKKIGEILRKILAAVLAFINGLASWLNGNYKRRSLTKEWYKVYLELNILLEKLFSGEGLRMGDLLAGTAQADGLDAEYGEKVPVVGRDILQKGKYTEEIAKIVGLLAEQEISHSLHEMGKYINETYVQLLSKAQALDKAHASAKPDFGGTGKGEAETQLTIVSTAGGDLSAFTEEVDRALAKTDAKASRLLIELKERQTTAQSLSDELRNKPYKLPANLADADHAMVTGRTVPYELALRYTDQYAQLCKDSSRSIGAAEARFAKNDPADTGDAPAQVYLDRSVVEVVKTYGKTIHAVAMGMAMVDTHFQAANETAFVIVNYAIEIASRWIEDHSQPHEAETAAHVMSFLASLKKTKREMDDKKKQAT